MVGWELESSDNATKVTSRMIFSGALKKSLQKEVVIFHDF